MEKTINNSTDILSLKGSLFTLTVLQLQDNDLDNFAQQLAVTVKKSPKFFQHAPIIIDIEMLENTKEIIDFESLMRLLERYQIIPVGIRGGNTAQQQQAIAAKLAIFPKETHTKKTPASRKSAAAAAAAATTTATESRSTTAAKTAPPQNKLITQPVRSGQQIYAKGDLVIAAPVSDGAEILADGNIHVYGVLRGRALAGVNGNTQARIFCQQMEAQLVSIAGHYLVNEQVPKKPVAEFTGMTQIYLKDGHLYISKMGS